MAEPKTKAAEKPVPNGNGNGRGANLGAIIVGGLALLLTLASGFWQLANPRTDISELNKKIEHVQRDTADKFLTLREHGIYVSSVERRLEKLEHDSVNAGLYTEANKAREEQIARIAARLGVLETSLTATYSPKDALTAIQTRIDRLEQWFKDSRNARSVGTTP